MVQPTPQPFRAVLLTRDECAEILRWQSLLPREYISLPDTARTLDKILRAADSFPPDGIAEPGWTERINVMAQSFRWTEDERASVYRLLAEVAVHSADDGGPWE